MADSSVPATTGSLPPPDTNTAEQTSNPTLSQSATATNDTATAADSGSAQPAPEPSQPADADLDASIANEITTSTNNTEEPSTAKMPTSPSNNLPMPPPQSGPEAPPPNQHPQAVLDPRIPQKKDATLREFLGKMDDYTPLIPDAVTDYYLTLSGLPPPPQTDRRLARLLALATQKFIADIAADAYQYSRIRSTNTTSNNPMTGLGGAAGMMGGAGGDEAGKGKKDAGGGKQGPVGGPRAGYGGGGAGGGQGRTVLTMEDLGMAVGEYGVNVKRGEFYR